MPSKDLMRQKRGKNLCRKVLISVAQSNDAYVKKSSLLDSKDKGKTIKKSGRILRKDNVTEKLCVCCKKAVQSEQQYQQEDYEAQKVLTRELPLYDDNCHLLGYLSEGTIINGPYCKKSKEPFLEEINIRGNDGQDICPPECKKASKLCGLQVPFPRWVNRQQYEMATST